MRLTKSGLKEMIRECLQEELAKDSLTEGGAMSGGYAEHGAIDNHARPGASTQPSKKNYLDRLKSKNHELVDVITIKGKDIKPGMITQAGQAREVKVEYSNHYKKDMVYIMHTNDYDGFWDVDSDMEVMADPDDKSKPFTGDYKELLKRGLKESVVEDTDSADVINEAATGFRLSSSALLSIEDLADAVYRDNDPAAIKKYASDKDIQDVTVEDLAIAAENSDYPREVKYLAAHMKNKGVATIGEFAAKLNDTKVVEALDEAEDFDLDNVFEALDRLYEEAENLASDETVDTNLDEGIFGKKKVEPMNSTKGQKNAAAIINKLSVDLKSDPNWDKQLIEYDYALGTNEFLSYGLEPSEDRVIGILCVEDGADLSSKSPISISPRNNRTRIANTVLQALENTQTASAQHLSFSLRKDAEVAAKRNALFIEIVQNER